MPSAAAPDTAAFDPDAEARAVDDIDDIDDIDAWRSAVLSAEITSPVDPSFLDLEAAVALVASGLATHVTLSGFPSWPGLLWKAHELARDTGVSIMPRSSGGDGRLELEVTRDPAEGD